MNRRFWSSGRIATVAIITILLIAGVAAAAWSLGSVTHLATGQHQESFTIEVDFDKFRQIMVRKNATAAIVGRSGMTLKDERIDDFQVDTSGDERPLLNAIRGKSKSEVDAVKQLTARLEDPAIDADELILRQHAVIETGSMIVETRSKSPAGNLEDYQTKLQAKPDGDRTAVILNVALKVRVDVPKMFVGRANEEVQQSAEDAVRQQAESIRAFVAQHADKRLILPELGGDR